MSQERIVFQVAIKLCASILKGAYHTSTRAQFTQQKLGALDGNLEVVRTGKVACSFCKAAQHQPIPGGKYLLIASRLYTPLAYLKENFTAAFERILQHFQAHISIVRYFFRVLCYVQDVLAFKITLCSHIVI